MMDKKSANGFSSKAGEGGGQRKQLPYSVETPYGFHLDLDFLKYVDDIEKGNTIKRVHIQRRVRGPKFSTLPRNFSLPGHGARPPPKDTWSGTSTLGSKPRSRVTEVQQIFDFKPSDGGTSSQSRAHGGSYALARPREEPRAGPRVFDEQHLGLQVRPNLLRTSSMPATVQHRKGSDSGDERPGSSENGSSENVFRAVDVMDRRVPQDRTGLHQQITVALKRVRELEEQVRTIPELKAQICSLREEREQLLLRLQAQTKAQTQAKVQVQAHDQAASPSLAQSTDSVTDSQPQGAGAPGSTSTGGVSEKQPRRDDPVGRAGREKQQESTSRSIVYPDAGGVLAQLPEKQKEASNKPLEHMEEKLSEDNTAQGTPSTPENVVSVESGCISRTKVCSEEDPVSVQQLQAKLIALEAKLTQASHDLERTNALLTEQMQVNQLKEERIQLLSEVARDEVQTMRGRSRRESVDRETETEKVDIVNQETETERSGTVDQGTDTEKIEVCIPRERANSIDRGTEPDRHDTQDQVTETEMLALSVQRGRANSVDQGTETERVDTADQVTETRAVDRVDQVTETDTNSPGLRPLRRRTNSVERGTETERVDTVDQVTETEGVRRADQQTETVTETQDRETSNHRETVEFGSMVTGTFLTESVVMESVVTEIRVTEGVESVVEDVDNVITDVVLTEHSALEESVGTETEVGDITVIEHMVQEQVVIESVKDHVAAEMVVAEQSLVIKTEVVKDKVAESAVLESVAPKSVVPESEVPKSEVLKSEVLKNEVLKSEILESEVPDSEFLKSEVPNSEATDSEVPKIEVPENEVPESVVRESAVLESEVPENATTGSKHSKALASERPPGPILITSQTQAQQEEPEQSQAQPQAKLKAQPQRPRRASSEASTSQPPRRGSGENQPQPTRQGSTEASTSQPPRRGSGEDQPQLPRRGSSEASTSQPPRRGSGESPTSPAALGQVVTRLTGLLNEQWAQLGSGGQQAAGLQQESPSVQKPAPKPAAKPTAKAATKPAGKPAGKSGPSKMSSIQSHLVSSLSALSAFYSPGQKAAASKQQGLKSIMKKNEGAEKQGNGGAKKNLKFVGVNGGYETTSSEESSGEDKEEEEEMGGEAMDISEPEDQKQQEEAQEGGPHGEDSDAGAQADGPQAGQTEAHGEPQDPEGCQELHAETSSGETVDKDFLEACLYIRDHMTEVSSPDKEMRQVLLVLYQEWFRVSSQKASQADTVTLYLREVGISTPTLLRYIVNLTDGNGNTALHYSVSHSNFPVVKLLLDTGLCEVNIQNKAGYTAVMLASLTAADGSEDMDVALQLLRQGDVNARASQGGQTALMLAVSHGRIAMVRLLLSCQADVNIEDRGGSTALMCACEHGHTEITRLLLECGHCDAGLTDKDGQSALSVAVQASHTEIVDLLRAYSDARASDPPSSTAPQ